MSRNEKLRVLCYDVSSNKRRCKISKLLEDVASRVQFSVFEARMTATELERVVKKVEAHLDKGDSLRVYTIARPGERHCEVHGSGVPIEKETGFWLL